MATGTGPFEEQDIAQKTLWYGGTSQDAIPWANVIQPAYFSTVIDSVTTGSSSATGTLTTGLGGFKSVEVYFRMSSMTGTASLLDFFIDTRLDGTNFFNLAAMRITSATGPSADIVVRLIRVQATSTILANTRADVSLDSQREAGWGNDLRIRRAVSGGTTAPIFSYTVTINAIS